jgi:hypothetical protein
MLAEEFVLVNSIFLFVLQEGETSLMNRLTNIIQCLIDSIVMRVFAFATVTIQLFRF